MKSIKASVADEATFKELLDAHVDITGAVVVEVKINRSTKVVHVNVNGVCVLRVCRICNLEWASVSSA